MTHNRYTATMSSGIYLYAAYLFAVVLAITGVPASADNLSPDSSPDSSHADYLGQEPPGDVPVIFAPGIVSTGNEHSAAMFTPDGNEVWFGRLNPVGIYFMKNVDGEWSEPQVASFCDRSTTSLYPVLSPDGNRVFFSSDRPIDPNGERLRRGGYHLWMSVRQAGRWLEPIHLDEKINFGRRQSCGSISEDGDMYFGSFIQDRSLDLFCSRLVEGKYTDPQSLTEINSPTPDHSPFIAADGSFLIFSSFRGGMGRSDLFISFRSADSSWSEPVNLGPKINSAYKDEYPWVTADGKYLFFNSNRPSSLNEKPIEGGSGNIYWVKTSIIEELRKVASADSQ